MTTLETPPPDASGRPTAPLPPVPPPSPSAPSPAAQPLPLPRTPKVRTAEVLVGFWAFFVVVVGLWIGQGGVRDLSAGWTPAWTSISQITGLLASALGLAGLVLVARLRCIERRAGLDHVFVWHKWLGSSMAILVGLHVGASLVYWSDGQSLWQSLVDLTGREPYMAGATVGALLVALVTITSIRSIRRSLSYETWYFVHLTAYVGLALAFAHEVVLGGHFTGGGAAWWFWVLAHVAVVVALLWGRWGRLLASMARPLRLTSVQPVAPGTVEIRLAGKGLRHIEADAGQFAILRPLAARLWWQGHPFSLSAEPTTAGLRFTVKDRGDASRAITELPIGTRIAVEGPYGALTPDELDPHRRLVMVVGGVGVAPARALLQRLPRTGPGDGPIVLFRARSTAELVHFDELRALAQARGGTVLTLVGPSATLAVGDPFSADSLRSAIPDVAERQAFVCGPERLIAAARSGLRAAGVPHSCIHFERSWW